MFSIYVFSTTTIFYREIAWDVNNDWDQLFVFSFILFLQAIFNYEPRPYFFILYVTPFKVSYLYTHPVSLYKIL